MLHQRQGWYPPALRWWNLILAILICWASIAVLQAYLHQSQRDGGVIFATKINDIPLRRSFWFLYMPTILAVTFSVFIVWIDHDAKRYEPYRQMSKPGGARAKDSILLHYPFDFVLAVPVVAVKRGHWLVFWASLAGVLTAFGVVPLQAGILSVKQTMRSYPQTFAVSEEFLPPSIQEAELNLRYANSAYGILELNETLPAFMTRNYTLAPFAARASDRPHAEHNRWTANTTMYSMDLECKKIDSFIQAGCEKGCDEFPVTYFNASAGCTVRLTDFVNNTIGSALRIRAGVSDGKARYKTFSIRYAGYYDNVLFSDRAYATPENSSCTGTVVAASIRNKEKDTDLPNAITAISCRPKYYERDVEATIDTAGNVPLNITYLGPKRPLPEGLFNASSFESTISPPFVERSSGYRNNSLPGTDLPQFRKANTDPDLSPAGLSLAFPQPFLTSMAVEISGHSIADFLDYQALEDAYASAYRLLFVRAMVDILDTDFSTRTHDTTGQLVIRTETLIFEPTFTYLVECILGLISISMFALLYMAVTKPERKKLIDEAASIAATMSMIADDSQLVSTFEDLDCSSASYFKRKLQKRRYILNSDTSGPHINESSLLSGTEHPTVYNDGSDRNDDMSVRKAIRPSEFRSYSAIPFTSFFIALAVLLPISFTKSQPQGLSLPSQKTITLNIITKYLPTAIATLIEPMWVLINRLLCVLQPLESLQGSKASALASISLNYISLPPQLMIAKAFRAGHFMVAMVCTMSLLSNLLATSFAGLFYQQAVPVIQPTLFSPPFDARFNNISGPGGSSGDRASMLDSFGYPGDRQDRKVIPPFLASETNYTRNTTLPAWVDDDAMYLPFMDSTTTTEVPGGSYRARTKYFTADPNCQPLTFERDYQLALGSDLESEENAFLTFLRVNVTSGNGTDISCTASIFKDKWLPQGPTAVELLSELSTSISMDKPISEYETCRSAAVVGWMRMVGFEQASSNNTLLMACRPKLVVGEADVHVNRDCVLQSRATNRTLDLDQSPEALSKYATNGLDNLIAHANQVMFIAQFSGYHNDSLTGEKFHYFINRAAGHLRFTDPNEPLPTFEEVIGPLTKAYQRLFAIWLSVNRDSLFIPATQTADQVPGSIVAPEQRLFLVTPLVIISETILSIYILVSILVYLRRPGRYLSRMPNSIAAVIALSASSAATRDLRETSHMTNKERDKYLKDLDAQYGYGSYVGGDGSVHVGIEKVPFVRYTKKTTFVGSRFEKEIRKPTNRNKSANATVSYTALDL